MASEGHRRVIHRPSSIVHRSFIECQWCVGGSFIEHRDGLSAYREGHPTLSPMDERVIG
jgi:hypothetical protein